MTQAFDGSNIKSLENCTSTFLNKNGALPSITQEAEIIITNKNLKEAHYRNFNVIIKTLYKYIKEHNILSLNSKNDSVGILTTHNGKSFPIFYKLRKKNRCFSILKKDLELFNIFLYENMPNTRMTLPQKPLCLDREVPVLRGYIYQFLNTSNNNSFRICKIIFDACDNGERVSYDKILITINCDNTKPELKLLVHCRTFNGVMCYALEKECIGQINEYFDLFQNKLLIPQKGETSLQALASIYKRKHAYKYMQVNRLCEIIKEKIDAKWKADPSKTEHYIHLAYKGRSVYFPVYIRKLNDNEIAYTIDKKNKHKIDNLIDRLPKLDLKKEIPLTYNGLSVFNNKEIEINQFVINILKNTIEKSLQNKTQVTVTFDDGKELTFFERYISNVKVIAILKKDKNKLFDFIIQEICEKYKVNLARKVAISDDEMVINGENFKKIFNVPRRNAFTKSKELQQMYKDALDPMKANIECRLKLQDGTYQSLIIGIRSNRIGTGRRYVFKKKDIALLRYYFGYIDKGQYEKELIIQQIREIVSQCKNSMMQCQELLKQDIELSKQCEELTSKIKELIKKYEKMINFYKEPHNQTSGLFRYFLNLHKQNVELTKRYDELIKKKSVLVKQFNVLKKTYKRLLFPDEKLAKQYEGLIKQYKAVTKPFNILARQFGNLLDLHNEIYQLYTESINQNTKDETAHDRKIVKCRSSLELDMLYERFDDSHIFRTKYRSNHVEIKRATNIFQEERFMISGGISTLLPIPLSKLYITGSTLGNIIIWNKPDEKALYVPIKRYQLESAMVRDICVLQDKFIVLHDMGIKIFNKKEGGSDYYESQNFQFNVIPECFSAYTNNLGQNIIYVGMADRSILVYKSEKQESFEFLGKIAKIPIETKGHLKKIIPLYNKRFLMIYSSGEIYKLPLKENIQKEDVILVEKLDEEIKGVSNVFNDSIFFITRDKMGHLYKFNETYDDIHKEFLLWLRFHKKNAKVQRLLLRDNVCYIYLTDKYGFNSDILKLNIHHK